MIVGASIIMSFRFYKLERWGIGKAIVFPLFVIYLCMVLGITLFNRLPYHDVRFNFEVFWSYKEVSESNKLLLEIILNYCMLIPLGIMTPLYVKKRWVIIGGFMFSVMIEFAQYFTQRGFFEFDDIIGNTIGVILGVIIYMSMLIIRRTLK